MLDKSDLEQIKNIVQGTEKRLSKEIQDSEARIIAETGKFIEDSIIPQLEEKADKTDIERLERKMDVTNAKIAKHDTAIQSLKKHTGLLAD